MKQQILELQIQFLLSLLKLIIITLNEPKRTLEENRSRINTYVNEIYKDKLDEIRKSI